MLARLSHIRNWIFDLDNTLYPASTQLFALIDARMTAYIADRFALDTAEARRVQKQYFFDHGTTLSGLIADHAIDPHEFLAYVHDIEMDLLEENAPLAAAIARLPGRKIVFTNADTAYATRVLGRLGLGDSFEAVHDIHAMALKPKPQASAYAGLCAAFGIDPHQSLFVEDMARNLAPAKAIGMTTVWIDNGSEQSAGGSRDFVDFTTHDINHWLHMILEAA
ncbi:MAG: pyrimidine 5'-nucleotidase [Pseudomonadota bacterium]|nr:pyrimidine 5'-nucleotidase [Pseudomonadota bacterium]